MAYGTMWEINLSHQGLNKSCLIKGSDKYVVEQKAIAQHRTWAAEESTILLESILQHTLQVDDAIDWGSLQIKKEFVEKKPSKPNLLDIPIEPTKTDLKYQPEVYFLDKVFGFKKTKLEDANKQFLSDYEEWKKKISDVDKKNIELEKKYLESLKKWEDHKNKHEDDEVERSSIILDFEKQYFDMHPEIIKECCDLVLTNSKYPDYFPKERRLEYQSSSKILIVDLSLPDIENLPNIKSVKYVATTNDFAETYITESALTKLYDDLLYQIALRTLHELYEADAINALDSIVFNGWVNSVDKSTGRNVNACIMSVNASKDEFMAINLKNVDPKACFKQLKGVGSAKLHGMSPVAPIMTINKQDKRFVSAYDVVEGVDESENLAAMDWQDFENLIREIFEKEFASSGGEVKITQASRDGGVDAIAFDPDPIRGGKIVIQAKRYTNVVGVSAVRDLYGTTLNEGATKGILVTTANFGSDAYDFAKGKPLTLLNGSNLLHLLEKHGHKARIDLKAAKIILADQKT